VNDASWISRSRATTVLVAAALVAVAATAGGATGARSSASNPKIAYLSFAVANSYDAPMLSAAKSVAKAQGASVNVQTHANHIATCARNTIVRADSMIAIAQRIQAATDAADAAKLMNQLVSLGNQLVAGFDANADGRITTQEGEGGLQQAEEHVQLMLAGEPKP